MSRRMHRGPARWPKPLAWAGVALALGLVFAAYLNPHVMVDLANRVWACV